MAVSPILWTGIIAAVIMPAYEILWNSYGFPVFAVSFLLTDMPVLCLFMAVLIPFHIGKDFEARTVNNKLTAGYERKQIYLAEMAVGMVYGSVLFTTNTVCVFLFSAVSHLKLSNGIAPTTVFSHLLTGFVCINSLASLFTAIGVIGHRRLVGVAVAVLLSLAMLHVGKTTVSGLLQPKYSIASEYFNDAAKDKVTENPLYISGRKRTAAKIHLLLSPFAQICYAPSMMFETSEDVQDYSLLRKTAPGHPEFCIVDLLELVLFCKIGICFFQKQDLK